MTTDEADGLRERKKAATREALSAAALRLALERGPENVRVDDIAAEAGVSPRTYNNYFSSREHAIVAAIAAERALRVAAALRDRPDDEPLADAVIAAVVDQYGQGAEPAGDALRLITSTAALREKFVDTVSSIERPVADAITARTGADPLAAAVLAAAVSAAVRVAVQSWVTRVGEVLVVPSGHLPDILREAIGHIAPALAAADR